MRCAALAGAWLALGLASCASVPTLTERPEEYQLFRSARTAPTEEERLSAAHRYLRQAPNGPHEKQLRAWFDEAEEDYYLEAFNHLPRLYAYQEALPNGPHIQEVRGRIAALSARKQRKQAFESEQDQKIAATEARLAKADADRRAFVALFKDWTSRLVRIRSFGEPTSELADETIFAFRLSEPRGSCQADICRKLMQPSYEVPGERELVARAALLEVDLQLEQGLLVRARLAGPELWTRLSEAMTLVPLPSPTPAQRLEAVNHSAQLVRALLEPVMPAAECEIKAEPPLLLERRCRGLSARMLAGGAPTEDDVIEIAPLPSAPAPVAPAPSAPAPARAPLPR